MLPSVPLRPNLHGRLLTVLKNISRYVERYKFHPFNVSGYVFQHRLVVERWLRAADKDHPFLVQVDEEKYLRRDIVVHHVNEIKDDNRLINLVPLTSSIHTGLHTALKFSPEDLWDEILEYTIGQVNLPPRF